MNWIIVTGHSRGLGLEIVRKLLETTESGVIGISRTETEDIRELREIYGERMQSLAFDLRDMAGIKPLFLERIAPLGPVCGLVNNAAMAYDDIVSNLNMEKLQSMYQVNVYAAMQLTKYAIRNMLLHRTEGALVHISSISVHTGYKGLSLYASTKGALEAFSRNAAREWGGKGIRSNCVVPGFMATEMSASLTEEQKARIYSRTALRRETDTASVADTVAFLLSKRASSITGSAIHVDNGTL